MEITSAWELCASHFPKYYLRASTCSAHSTTPAWLIEFSASLGAGFGEVQPAPAHPAKEFEDLFLDLAKHWRAERLTSPSLAASYQKLTTQLRERSCKMRKRETKTRGRERFARWVRALVWEVVRSSYACVFNSVDARCGAYLEGRGV